MIIRLGEKMRAVAFADSDPLDFSLPLTILSNERADYSILAFDAQQAMKRDGLDRSEFIFETKKKMKQIDRAIFLLRNAQAEDEQGEKK